MAQTLPLTRAGCASLMRPPVRSGSANRRPSGHPCLSAARIDSGARAESVEWSANGVAAGRGFAAMLPARPVHSRRAGRGSAGPVALFTGIVEEMGAVRELRQEGADGGWVMRVDASVVLEGVHLGDSIAVNGTCLTVTEFDEGSFVVGACVRVLIPRSPLLRRVRCRTDGDAVHVHARGACERSCCAVLCCAVLFWSLPPLARNTPPMFPLNPVPVRTLAPHHHAFTRMPLFQPI
eukprot:TRINITY_DN19444_c0_g2_i2.p1 TRINITY_DN19444_c0_g2~~TRINITY_DN19444_c0_g2_i2.p1  ORF type:complete len:258 (-),score=-45.62 TRINITY_DN19444_c0_g2_i2:72-779(-)